MSVFNCALKYKTSKYSKEAVKNQLVAHKFIDEKFNILNLNKFRQANTELSNDASEKLGKKVRLFAEENGGKKALPYEDVFREIDSKALQIQSLIKKAQTTEFDKELAAKIQSILQELYPEIKLKITNNPVWEQGDNVFNQEEYNNQVNYRLKAVDILTSSKADEVFAKGLKNKWTLDKMLSELQVPKQQKALIDNVLESMSYFEGIPVNHQIALELASKYSYAVEINISKTELQDYEMVDETGEGDFQPREFIPDTELILEEDEDGNVIGTREVLSELGKKQIEEREDKRKPTQHYANLTVPGGTNYTENEISTPLITPSIKGHAQFATNKGIGWFRSDDKSDNEPSPYPNEPPYGDSLTPSKIKTRRILEIQSDLFQKWRNNFEFEGNKYTAKKDDKNVWHYYKNYNEINTNEYIKTWEIFLDTYLDNADAFTKLLQKDNNWVTFFIKSIIQDSAKQSYEKVLFPSGDTVSKVEGHSTLEEFKKQKEDRIKELEEKKKNKSANISDFLSPQEAVDLLGPDFSKELPDNYIENKIDNEINQLKLELERVETEGFGALKPIYNFYENAVTNILKKQGYNATQITDEYGNTWNEITINQVRDLANVLLQRNEANKIIGQANIKAMSVLIDAVNQKQDTLPHEYAHHYIAWFRNTPIVQEAIKKWGSEEALVQSIGEQVVKQKGEAYTWWNKFVKWILNQFNSLSELQKQDLTRILTDAFLTRQDLRSFQDTQNLSEQIYSKQVSEKVFSINITSPEQFKQYAAQNKDKLLILESTPDMTAISVPGIGSIEGLALDNVMTIATIGATKQDIKDSFEDLDIELRADGTFDVVFVNQDYGSSLKNSDPESYNLLNSLLKNNFNFNNTNANFMEAAENNQAQVDYQLSIDFSEVADVMNNLTCK